MKQSDDINCAPVLLIGFNRPDFMAAQIDAVRPARPARLYISVDGPRTNRPGEVETCRKTQECAMLMDWPCKVKTLFRNENLGCKLGVSGAITWFFENEDEGIILEDDCRPTPDFFRFATEMLAKYRNNERIGAICGFNHFNLQTNKSISYHFSRHMDIWGWASWRRSWAKYDVNAGGTSARNAIAASSMTPHFKKMFTKWLVELDSGLSTWDVQFSITSLANGWLNIVPKKRLVANAGLADTRAAHTNGYIWWGPQWSKAGKITFPLVHPDKIECDVEADLLRERTEAAILPRALTWLGCKFPFFSKILNSLNIFVNRRIYKITQK